MLQGAWNLVGQLKAQQTSKSKILYHSVRKTSICCLLQNEVHPLHVSQIRGHKNRDSLKHYYVALTKQRKKMLDIINANDQSPGETSTSFHPGNQSKRPLIESESSSNEAKQHCPEVVIVPARSSSSSSGISSDILEISSTTTQNQQNLNTLEGLFRGANITNVYVYPPGTEPLLSSFRASRNRRIINDLDED